MSRLCGRPVRVWLSGPTKCTASLHTLERALVKASVQMHVTAYAPMQGNMHALWVLLAYLRYKQPQHASCARQQTRACESKHVHESLHESLTQLVLRNGQVLYPLPYFLAISAASHQAARAGARAAPPRSPPAAPPNAAPRTHTAARGTRPPGRRRPPAHRKRPWPDRLPTAGSDSTRYTDVYMSAWPPPPACASEEARA